MKLNISSHNTKITIILALVAALERQCSCRQKARCHWYTIM